MEEKRFLSPGGWIFCGLAVLAAGALYLALSFAPKGAVAVVELDGETILERKLSEIPQTETFPVEGENGVEVVIQLSSQGACMATSTCPDQVCVETGLLTRAGESAICLPARVTLRLEGGQDQVDATVY